MTLTFPSDPGAQTPVNTYGPDSSPLSTDNGVLYTWDGDKWVANKQISYDGRYVNVTGDTMTGDLTVPNLISQGTVTGTNIPTNGTIVGYQQGTWIPELTGSASGVTAITTTATFWTRIGNSVTVSFSFGSGDKVTSGDIRINGLPYACGADNILFQGFIGDRGPVTYGSGFDDMYVRISKPNSFMQLMQKNADNHGDFSSGSLPFNYNFRGFCTYVTDNTDWTPINGATVS